MATNPTGAGYRGFQRHGTASQQFNAIEFLIRSIVSGIATATLVQVKAVTNSGGVMPVGFVDILPLINQINGDGNAVPHAVIYHCPYSRLQGGANAVILDPQVGDIGVAVFASRDASSVAANKAQANQGSWRTHDMADGLYIGGMLNGTPTQYVQFNTGGITILSPNTVTIKAPAIVLDGPVTTTSTIVATGNVTGAGTSLHTHLHGGVSPGGSNTGVPV